MENIDYEKAYKAVLQTATQWIKDGCTDKEKICLESVFPELRESEDERIRKEIIGFIQSQIEDGNSAGWDRWIAYLEKQKEPVVNKEGMYYWDGKKFIYCGYPALEDNPYDFAMNQQKEHKPHRVAVDTCEAIDKVREFDEQMEKEQKPAEWSEEDENALKYIHELISYGYSTKFMDAQTAHDMREWVNKSLRPQPHWKPTEEMIKALDKAIKNPTNGMVTVTLLNRLYEQLKQL